MLRPSARSRYSGMKKALVLSGGGAKGAYEAGAVAGLLALRAQFDIVVGSSIGALIGAYVAYSLSQGEKQEAVAGLTNAWRDTANLTHLNWLGFLKALIRSLPGFNVLSHLDSVLNAAPFHRVVDQLIPRDVRFSDLEGIDLCVTATDLCHGKTTVFSKDNDIEINKAVKASIALPLAFPAYRYDSSWYVDGGLLNNTPLNIAISRGATHAVVVRTGPGGAPAARKPRQKAGKGDCIPPGSVAGVAGRVLDLMLEEVMYESLEMARKTNEILRTLRAASPAEKALALKVLRTLGYTSSGRKKHVVEIVEIAPSRPLDLQTVDFRDGQKLEAALRLGAKDAQKLVADTRWLQAPADVPQAQS